MLSSKSKSKEDGKIFDFPRKVKIFVKVWLKVEKLKTKFLYSKVEVQSKNLPIW